MNHYRAGNLLNIQKSPRVRVTVANQPQPPVVRSRHAIIQNPRARSIPAPTPSPPTIQQRQQPVIKPVPRNRPITITPHEQRANRPQPVGYVGRQPRIVSQHRAISLVENRRSRAQLENLEQHHQAIMRLKDIGIGRILIILANGPSINEVPVEQLNNISNIDLMCVNKPNQKVWPTKYWSFCDQSQYTRNQAAWDTYTGTLLNATAVRTRHRHQVLIKNVSGTGFSKDLIKGYYIGRSTTFASMQIALWMNYDKVYIFGCDMAAVNGQLHFYGQNPDVNNAHRVERFKQEAESFTYAAQNLSGDERQKFVFCSNYNTFPFVDSFQRMDHLNAVQLILESAKNKQNQ
jgi:uncharacterized protein YjiS (DUF1127 family)